MKNYFMICTGILLCSFIYSCRSGGGYYDPYDHDFYNWIEGTYFSKFIQESCQDKVEVFFEDSWSKAQQYYPLVMKVENISSCLRAPKGWMFQTKKSNTLVTGNSEDQYKDQYSISCWDFVVIEKSLYSHSFYNTRLSWNKDTVSRKELFESRIATDGKISFTSKVTGDEYIFYGPYYERGTQASKLSDFLQIDEFNNREETIKGFIDNKQIVFAETQPSDLLTYLCLSSRDHVYFRSYGDVYGWNFEYVNDQSEDPNYACSKDMCKEGYSVVGIQITGVPKVDIKKTSLEQFLNQYIEDTLVIKECDTYSYSFSYHYVYQRSSGNVNN